MKNFINSFAFSATVRTEPKVTKTQNSAVARFAASILRKDGDKYISALQDLEYWNKNADFSKLQKGTLLNFKGFLLPDEWEKDGLKKSRITFVVTEISDVEEVPE